MAKLFKIFNVDVYGLRESIVASRLPMQIDVEDYSLDLDGVKLSTDEQKQRAKAIRLSEIATETHLPHDCYLKGVIVEFDVTYPQYWALQMGRYHFADIVSSTSKMHMLCKSNIQACCNEYVDEDIMYKVEQMLNAYNHAKDNPSTPDEEKKRLFMRVLSNLPCGFMLTQRMVTNYLQLKTIYKQRRDHRLPEWQEFCDWIETLPMMKELLSLKTEDNG